MHHCTHTSPPWGLNRPMSSPKILTNRKVAAAFGAGRARLRPLTDHACPQVYRPAPSWPVQREEGAAALRVLVALAALAVIGFTVWGLLPRTATQHAPTAEARPRTIVVGGALTETVVALGAGDRLVGVDTSSIYPEAVVAALPKVGYQRRLAAEGILALEPTEILLGPDAGPDPVLAQLEAAGVTLVRFPEVSDVAGALARIRSLGRHLGREEAAEALCARMQRDLDAVAARLASTEARPRVAFLYARGKGTLHVAGQGTSAEAVIALAGGTNALTDFEGFRSLSSEGLLGASPEVLLLTTGGLASLGGEAEVARLPGIAGTPAAQAGRIIALDDLALLGFGPRLPEAVRDLAQVLHPAARSQADAPPTASTQG